ncbi:MAG TPA: phosphatase PAP2 family protein [Solirubrobacteraceae bacterium]|nr:phosphatase PAP2 family protein [Solirubrobacteraceae bacterium]
MSSRWRREERLTRKIVGRGARRGNSAPSRAGDVLRRPLVWGVMASAIALTGRRGRRAALRGATCAAVASLLHLPLKHAIRRPRPRGARLLGSPLMTSSFPSGHTASDLSFVFGASSEAPSLFIPLSAATVASHWSLIRARKHYPSDVVAGGALALAVTAASWKLRPPASAGGPPR